MQILKTILQYIMAIPLVLFGRVEDPFVAGMAAEEDEE